MPGDDSGGLEPREKLPPPWLTPRQPSRRDAIFLGPHGLRAGWAAALYVAIFLAFLLAAAGIEAMFRHPLTRGTVSLSPAFLFHQEVLSLAAALGAAAVMGRLENRSFSNFGLPWTAAFQGRFWQGVLWGLAQVSLLLVLIYFFHGYSFGSPMLGGAAIVRYALEWGGGFLLVGFFEEFFFRGYVQATLARGMGFWPAALLLSAGFGAVHLANPGEGRAGAASVFVIGLFLCFTLWRTGNLWFAIGWHAAFDFGETYLYSVPDSGLLPTHSLLSSSLHGPGWLTGGSVGPEGSIFAFVFVALAFVLFDRIYRPRSEQPV